MLVNYLIKSEKKTEKNYTKIRNITLSAGLICLSLGLILPHFYTGYRSIDFFSGFLIGISIVANIMSLILSRKYKK